MTPEAARLAAALDAVDAVPGSTDLVDETPCVRQEVKDAIMDVMLGPVVDNVTGRRAHSGINTYIRHDIAVPKVRLVAWQDTLRRSLEKL